MQKSKKQLSTFNSRLNPSERQPDTRPNDSSGRRIILAGIVRADDLVGQVQLSTCLASQGGMTLAFTLIIVSTIMVIALAMSVFSMGQMRIFFSAKDSAYAIFAGTSGLERALYQTRVGTVNCGNFIDNLATDIVYKYDVEIVADTCGSSPTLITSTGIYRQTSRKIEANW